MSKDSIDIKFITENVKPEQIRYTPQSDYFKYNLLLEVLRILQVELL